MPEPVKKDEGFAADLASVLGAPAEEKAVEAPAAEKPVVETKPAEEAKLADGAKPTEEKPADKPEPEFDLVSYLNDLSATSMRRPAEAQPVAETKAEVKEAVKDVKAALTDAGIPTDWLPKTDEEFDQIMESRQGFTSFVQNMLGSIAKTIESRTNASITEAMNRTSSYVNQHVQHQMGVQELVREFYQKNPELLPIRQQVGWLANKLTAEHPDWSYEKLFEESAKAAKLVLGQIQKMQGGGQQAAQPNGTQKAPAFAKPVTNRKQPAENAMSDLQKDIQALLS